MAENVTLYTKDSSGNQTPLNPSTIAEQVSMNGASGEPSTVEREIAALRQASSPEEATEERSGLMSAADKAKLNGVEEEANRYVHPAYNAAEEGLYLVAVDGTGHVSSVRAVEKKDIVALGLPAQDTLYSLPTASAGTLGGVKVGDGLAIGADGTLTVQRPAIRTVMDAEAVPGTLYTLGEQASVTLALPAEGEAGQMLGVIFYSGATPAALSVTGALPFNFAPTANSRVELNALHDGEAWQVLWAEQATEAASAASEEAGA